MKTKLTIPEFEALLRFAFEAGQVSGKYMDVSVGNREKLQVKGFYHSFADWYKAEVDQTAEPAAEEKECKCEVPQRGGHIKNGKGYCHGCGGFYSAQL